MIDHVAQAGDFRYTQPAAVERLWPPSTANTSIQVH